MRQRTRVIKGDADCVEKTGNEARQRTRLVEGLRSQRLPKAPVAFQADLVDTPGSVARTRVPEPR